MPIATKLVRVVNYYEGVPENHMTLWSRDLARSRDRLKKLYIYRQNANDYQTWKGDDLEAWWRLSI